MAQDFSSSSAEEKMVVSALFLRNLFMRKKTFLLLFVSFFQTFLLLSSVFAKKSKKAKSSSSRDPVPQLTFYGRSTAVAILGHRLDLENFGAVSNLFKTRLQAAAKLYRTAEEKKDDLFFIVLGQFGANGKSSLVEDGSAVATQSRQGAEFLIKEEKIPAGLVLEENASKDTIGNAFFLRQIHLQNMSFIKKVIVVTNDFHMPRTKEIFNHILFLPHCIGRKDFCPEPISRPDYTLEYAEAPNGKKYSTNAERRNEEKALKRFVEKVAPNTRSMYAMWKFMFQEHKAYAVAKRHKERTQLVQTVEKTKDNIIKDKMYERARGVTGGEKDVILKNLKKVSEGDFDDDEVDIEDDEDEVLENTKESVLSSAGKKMEETTSTTTRAARKMEL